MNTSASAESWGWLWLSQFTIVRSSLALLLEWWRRGDTQTMPARYSPCDSNVTACMRLPPPLITHLGHRDMIRAGAVPASLLTATVRCFNISFPVEELCASLTSLKVKYSLQYLCLCVLFIIISYHGQLLVVVGTSTLPLFLSRWLKQSNLM